MLYNRNYPVASLLWMGSLVLLLTLALATISDAPLVSTVTLVGMTIAVTAAVAAVLWIVVELVPIGPGGD